MPKNLSVVCIPCKCEASNFLNFRSLIHGMLTIDLLLERADSVFITLAEIEAELEDAFSLGSPRNINFTIELFYSL